MAAEITAKTAIPLLMETINDNALEQSARIAMILPHTAASRRSDFNFGLTSSLASGVDISFILFSIRIIYMIIVSNWNKPTTIPIMAKTPLMIMYVFKDAIPVSSATWSCRSIPLAVCVEKRSKI